jgi:hypothetical protein
MFVDEGDTSRGEFTGDIFGVIDLGEIEIGFTILLALESPPETRIVGTVDLEVIFDDLSS